MPFDLLNRRDFVTLLAGATAAWPLALEAQQERRRWSPPAGVLNLPRIDWEGGSAYYARFSKAQAAGWSDPAFFPIGVWLAPTQDPRPANFARAGVNYYMAAEHNPPLSNVTARGISVMPQMNEWRVSEVGTNPLAVSWFTADEPDMDTSLGNENARLAHVQNLVALANARKDGRFTAVNIGNGVHRTLWSPNTVHEIVRACDIACVDQYAYASPKVRRNFSIAPNWRRSADAAQCSAAYGWLADQMRSFQDPNNRKPFFVAVETARPLRYESNPSTITVPQIGGAVWAAIRHEARGIMFFQQNNDPSLPGNSMDNVTLRNGIAAITSKIRSLAPVLNTQSYQWTNPGVDVMLKAHDEFAYIFAGIGLGQSTGSKTFTLPPNVNGTVAEVVGESRSINISGDAFSDVFPNEYTHRVYKITL